MSTWDDYPVHYRAQEIKQIINGIRAGECVSLVGLSGAGKSNLLGFLSHRQHIFAPVPRFVLVDCNRLDDFTINALQSLIRQALEESSGSELPVTFNSLSTHANWIEGLIREKANDWSGLCLMIDRFDVLESAPWPGAIYGNLRAMRDRHKYWLTYLISSRTPMDEHNEVAELCLAHTLWLRPLSQEDARWNVIRYSQRVGKVWDDSVVEKIVQLSWGYPSFLRGVCEAYSNGANLELADLIIHPSIERRLQEFWDDMPNDAAIRKSGLEDHPFLANEKTKQKITQVDESHLTAKEYLLLKYFRFHSGEICEKDDLIRAVWPEDKIYLEGIRDDSLAQLIRRLRVKIEPNPAEPKHILTIPGRGYRFIVDEE